MRKNRAQRTLPWGTPYKLFSSLKQMPFIFSHCGIDFPLPIMLGQSLFWITLFSLNPDVPVLVRPMLEKVSLFL